MVAQDVSGSDMLSKTSKLWPNLCYRLSVKLRSGGGKGVVNPRHNKSLKPTRNQQLSKD
jgi:hypothetical protein